MASADEYAAWIVKNADKRGTPEFDTVSKAYLEAKGGAPAPAAPAAREPDATELPSPFLGGLSLDQVKTGAAAAGKGFGDVVLGAQRYAGKGIRAVGDLFHGKTTSDLIAPVNGTSNALQKAGSWLERDAEQGRTNLAAELAPMRERNPGSAAVGEVAGNLVATAPVGGALAKVAGAAKAPTSVVNAIRTSGMQGGNALTRAVGGGLTGGVSAALVNPDEAEAGAVVGAALPPAIQGAGKLGRAVGAALRGGSAPEVAALAKRAEELGIQIPADRLVDSKPMNALASALNYVPFSGRAGTEATMKRQLDAALSRTFGQDSPNVTAALRKARTDLGAKFDAALQGTPIHFDRQLLDSVAEIQTQAERELGADGLKAIHNQVAELVAKGATGTIDGQAAYNVKRTLDRIAERNAPEAFHARELKKALMGALDRSLGPEQAAAFAQTRKQYGTMLDLESLASNGAEGGISVGRLANLKNIGNPELQELADIAAQFVKTRESPHGAMQRATVGAIGSTLAGPAAMAGFAAGGRGANAALNSKWARRAALGEPNALQIASDPALRQLAYRSAPVLAADR